MSRLTITPLSSSPPLAIVICSKDRAWLLEGALSAIERVRRPGDETIVVDSASTDDSVKRVAGRFPWVRFVRCDQPGASRARNCGVRVSSAPVVAFTDDDCRPEAGWADAIEAIFREEPATGFLTGMVRPDGGPGPALAVGGADVPQLFRYGDDPAELGQSANFAARRQALDAIGGFDEVLGAGTRFAGAEDHDVFWRLLRAGWMGRYDPRVSVVHQQWRTTRQAMRSQYGYGLGSGAFALKAIRIDRREGLPILGHRVWRFGALSAARALRDRYERGAAGDVLRLAGVVAGFVRAARLPVAGERYVPR